MYDTDVVKLALEALELGFSVSEAAELAGVSRNTVANWRAGHLPHPRHVPRKMIPPKPPRAAKMVPPTDRSAKEAPVDLLFPSESEKRLYEPPASGPLSGLEPSQIENLLLRAVLADLKAEGFDLDSTSNRSKCELGERLRRATGLPLRCIIGFLKISKSSYEYHRARLSKDKYAHLREEVREAFFQGDARWGYRTIWAHLRRRGIIVSEKVVRRIMADEGLKVVYGKRKGKGWSSYVGEVSAAPANIVARSFHADVPNELWLTDITEFKLPGNRKVYLSPVIDCFDGKPIAWRIGTHPDKALANESLKDAIAQLGDGVKPIIHSDRGGHYRWPEWVAICDAAGLTRSMSAKACSPDNAACEGFFGRLKNEFFYYRDWEGTSTEDFIEQLDAYLRYYCGGRIKRSLGWLSPDEYRKSLGYAC